MNKTYPIYELISDPQKKEELKKATEDYIMSKSIEVLPTACVYRSYNQNDHFYATIYHPTYGDKNEWKYEGSEFSIYTTQVKNTVPLYQYWNGTDHFYTPQFSPHGIYDWKYEYILGYIYQSAQENTVPLYQYWNGRDHFYTTWKRPIEGYTYEYIVGYVFNNEKS